MKNFFITALFVCLSAFGQEMNPYAHYGGLGHKPIKSVAHPENIIPEISEDRHSPLLSQKFHQELRKDFHLEATTGNQLTLKENKNTFIHAREMIRSARKTLWAANMFFKKDALSAPVFSALKKAAKKGIDVRLILDKFFTQINNPEAIEDLKKAGVKVALVPVGLSLFNEIIPGAHVAQNFHSKYWIRDCSEVLISGGNVIDSQVAASGTNWGYRDTSLSAQGPLASSACLDFAELWATYGEADEKSQKHFAHNMVKIQNERMLGLRGDQAIKNVKKQNGLCYFIHQGEHTDKNLLSDFLLNLVLNAKKYLYMNSLHDFEGRAKVPAQHFFSEVKKASERGVTVDLLVNGMQGAWSPYEGNPKLFKPAKKSLLKFLTKNYKKRQVHAMENVREYLKDSSIRGYEYFQFNHNKLMFVDGVMTVVSTHNLEMRSFDGNGEVGAACIDQALNEQMKKMFVRDLKNSKPIEVE